ncbi:hypothetical protein BHQ29_04180 [Pseudomonas sp. LPH1]|nr:hypothetical protein [Pseudomonas sp. LPH1]AQZ32550.1 hypothetical protein BHQ29_04180 [Pseudomonas sp. LPH1]
MIDSFLKVIEKGIELLNTRQNNKREYFQIIISPLFDEFEKVASEYFKLFDSRGINEEEALNIRAGYLQSRIKVTELAKKYAAESQDKELVAFFDSISNFFYGNFVLPEQSMRTDGRHYIDILTGEKTFSRFTKKPHSLIEAKENLEQRWEATVQMFAKLKLKYGTPLRY